MQLCTARLHPKGTSPRCALRAPRLLRSLAMTNLGVLSSRVIARRAQARRGNLKQAVTNPPGPSYDAAVYREIAPQGHFPALRAQGATAPAEPRNDKSGSASLPCHSEERSDVGISCRHLRFRRGFPVFRLVLRDCHALLRKARNDKSGDLPHPEERNDKSGAVCPCGLHSMIQQKGRTCSPALLYYYFIFIQPRI